MTVPPPLPVYQFLLAMITLIHPSSRTYMDPWSGQLFGEGGVERNLHPKIDPNARISGVKGGVIMSKLGNETAKYVRKNVTPIELFFFHILFFSYS